MWVDLQQRWLWRRAGAAMERARERGYRFRPRGLRPRQEAEGQDPRLPRRLIWQTGLAGPYLRVDDQVYPLACSAEDLDRALLGAISADRGKLLSGPP